MIDEKACVIDEICFRKTGSYPQGVRDRRNISFLLLGMGYNVGNRR